jgi:NTE family protein
MTKVAVACQGGGMHAAFEVGVLTEILNDVEKNKFDLVGLSGTSAGALCTLIVWYGLAQKNGKPGSAADARTQLKDCWDKFVASPGAEAVLNFLTYRVMRAEEMEVPGLGINAPLVAGSLNPYGALYQTVAAWLPHLYVRQEYFDLDGFLKQVCPEFNGIEWQKVTTRLLIGASEVVNGLESVFDSYVNTHPQRENKGMVPNPAWKSAFWRQRLSLTLDGVAASGTLPIFRKAQQTGYGVYWDGLYSQNPPVRDFFWGMDKADKALIPDELWIVRINPQQQAKAETPKLNAAILDRENELMGNLSLNKELDFLMLVNKWKELYKNESFGKNHKHVTVRTIKMTQDTAATLQYSSKFNRSRDFMEKLREKGKVVARDWLNLWQSNKAGEYPEDAAWP